jgi:hypothetical protein
MSKQDSLFDQLPEQRKPTWQDESEADFKAARDALLSMCRRIKTPFLKDTRKIDSLLRQLRELQEKRPKDGKK